MLLDFLNYDILFDWKCARHFFVWNNILSQFISSSLGRAATTRKMSCWWFSGRTRLRRNQCVSWHLQEKLRRCLAGFDLRKKYSKHFIVKYVRQNSIFLTTDRKKSKMIIYSLKKIVSNNDKKKYLKIIDKAPLIFFFLTPPDWVQWGPTSRQEAVDDTAV